MKNSPSPSRRSSQPALALALLFLALAGAVGLGTVWMRQQISASANRNRQLQQRLVETERRINEVQAEVAAAQNPEVLLAQNARLQLGLVLPREAQVVRVDEAVETRLARKRNQELYGVFNGILATQATYQTSSVR